MMTRLRLAWRILFGPAITGAGDTTSPEVAAIAARGMRSPLTLTAKEIRTVCASALAQAPDVGGGQ